MKNYEQPESVYPPLEEPDFDNEESDEREFEDDFGQYPGDYDFYASQNIDQRQQRIREAFAKDCKTPRLYHFG